MFDDLPANQPAQPHPTRETYREVHDRHPSQFVTEERPVAQNEREGKHQQDPGDRLERRE